MLKTKIGAILLLAIWLTPMMAFAGDFDGSKPLLCATTEAYECDAGQSCKKVPIADINLPQFLRIDFKQKHISGTREDGETKTTAINNMAKLPDRLIMQGMQNGLAWGLIITEPQGKMTLTASGPQTGFAAFGACTPYPAK
jgi:hypothetical protein